MNSLKKGVFFLVICALFYVYAQNLKENLNTKFNDITPNSEIHHIVLCWLKNPTTELRETIIKKSEALKQIPELKLLRSGKAIESERPIVDDSFDLGFFMTFDSVDDMNRYIEHPIHKHFVENEVKPYLDRVLVYDF